MVIDEFSVVRNSLLFSSIFSVFSISACSVLLVVITSLLKYSSSTPRESMIESRKTRMTNIICFLFFMFFPLLC